MKGTSRVRSVAGLDLTLVDTSVTKHTGGPGIRLTYTSWHNGMLCNQESDCTDTSKATIIPIALHSLLGSMKHERIQRETQ